VAVPTVVNRAAGRVKSSSDAVARANPVRPNANHRQR
jgi:hypothetical protein